MKRLNESIDSNLGQSRITLRCPSCFQPLASGKRDSLVSHSAIRACARCSFWMRNDRGIWIALTPEREVHYRQFAADYERIRALEGRGSASADYYLQLPFRDVTGANARQWKIRAQSYRCIEHQILPSLEARYGSMKVLDIGAGNCWLSYRLALRGHQPVAVDLLVNEADGLGAAHHYAEHIPAFPRFQAEMDCLPFGNAQFECAIFNASFHYSVDYRRTLAEVIRCLRPGGTVIIADTPWYSRKESGEQMLQERHAFFQAKFGTSSDSVASREYLTDESLHELEQRFGLRWRTYHPSYGLRWALRPIVAKLRGKREPSRFRIYAAEVQR